MSPKETRMIVGHTRLPTRQPHAYNVYAYTCHGPMSISNAQSEHCLYINMHTLPQDRLRLAVPNPARMWLFHVAMFPATLGRQPAHPGVAKHSQCRVNPQPTHNITHINQCSEH